MRCVLRMILTGLLVCFTGTTFAQTEPIVVADFEGSDYSRLENHWHGIR